MIIAAFTPSLSHSNKTSGTISALTAIIAKSTCSGTSEMDL
jgi:hypothetical protein